MFFLLHVCRLLLCSIKPGILQQNEVDAFLATAVEVQSRSGEDLQKLEVLLICSECVLL